MNLRLFGALALFLRLPAAAAEELPGQVAPGEDYGKDAQMLRALIAEFILFLFLKIP